MEGFFLIIIQQYETIDGSEPDTKDSRGFNFDDRNWNEID